MAEAKKAAGKEEPAKETEMKSAAVKEETNAPVKTPKKRGRKPKEATEAAGTAKKTSAAKTAKTTTAGKASRTTRAAKTAAKTAKEAKAVAAKVEEVVHFQFNGKSYTSEDLVKICKDVWVYDLNGREEDFKSVELYVKPEENTTYYVINGSITGNFRI